MQQCDFQTLPELSGSAGGSPWNPFLNPRRLLGRPAAPMTHGLGIVIRASQCLMLWNQGQPVSTSQRQPSDPYRWGQEENEDRESSKRPDHDVTPTAFSVPDVSPATGSATAPPFLKRDE